MPQVDASSHYPLQIVDAMRAMAYVRGHADEWGVDADRVYALGFSAGEHVVGSLAERFDDSELLAQAGTTTEVARPSGLVLCYPMVTAEKLCRVKSGDTPEQTKLVRFTTRAVFGKEDPSAEEYARVLRTGGRMVMVIPGARHLFGLKEVLYEHPYENRVQDTAINGFSLTEEQDITKRITLRTEDDLWNLFTMTPYFYRTSPADKERLRARAPLETEISFKILVYKKAE
jgi:acetyl esterase/lipase